MNVLHFRLEQQQNTSGDQSDQLTAASDCLPQAAKEFFDKQIAMARVRKHGQRYDKKQKDMAIQLYKQSPSCYSELQKMFQLPSSTTLRRHQVVSQEASPVSLNVLMKKSGYFKEVLFFRDLVSGGQLSHILDSLDILSLF